MGPRSATRRSARRCSSLNLVGTRKRGTMSAQPQPVGGRFITFKIWRQETPDHEGRYETFRLPYKKGANVISCLMEIQRNPVNAEGARTTPVVWDSNCLEEVCGSCTMNINGKARMACSALVDRLLEEKHDIVLEPLRK